jgi:hypothetical protein
VTAFTIAHSITLAAATLGFVNVPGPPVEATIALSIMLVAVEILNARRGKPSLTARLPWLVAFSFGLLHGFGFAGALAEVGLPQHAIPVALLFFNLGVEMGQLAFVAAVLTTLGLFRSAMALRLEPTLIQRAVNRLDVITPYVVGTVAAFWLIERTSAFFCVKAARSLGTRVDMQQGWRLSLSSLAYCSKVKWKLDHESAKGRFWRKAAIRHIHNAGYGLGAPLGKRLRLLRLFYWWLTGP